MTELRTIDNVAEDRALIAVRAWYQALDHGYGVLVRDALKTLDLAAYCPEESRRFALDPEGLATRLEELRVSLSTIAATDDYATRIADRAYRLVGAMRDQMYDAIATGRLSYSEVAQPAPEFSADDLVTRYGATGALPRPTGEDREAIEESRREVMAAFLDQAIIHNPCGDFESCAKRIGLSRYLPKRDMEVSAEVPGIGEVTATVQLDRRGRIDPATLVAMLRNAAYERVNGTITRDAVAHVKGLPDGALA